MFPTHLFNARDHAAFLFYENDPGVPVPRANDLTYVPDKTATPPEWAWWEFDIDDLTAGKADLMKSLMNATDPESRAVSACARDGKLILWHGWNDAGAPPEPTKDYYDEVVATTFGGDAAKRASDARLFMFPGMGHCGGGPGPNTGIRSAARRVGRERHGAGRRRGDGTRPTAASTTSAASARTRKSRATPAPPAAQNDPANWVEGELHLPLAQTASGSWTAVPDAALRWMASVHSM